MGTEGSDNDRSRPDKQAKVSTSQAERNQSLLRKRFAMEPRMIREFESVLISDINTLNKWRIVQEESDFVWKLLQSAGAMAGVAAVAITFFGLNRVPRYLARNAARKQQSPYKLEKPKTIQLQQSPFESLNKDAVEKQVKRSRTRFLFTAMELFFDIGMSLGVGAGVAFLLSDEKEAEKAFIEIPLHPGRSLLSDTLCPNLLEEYQRQWKNDGNRRVVLQEPHHRVLQIIIGLAQNCRHRQVMEQLIRKEKGLPPMGPVDIPDTGVRPFSENPLLTMMEEMGESVGWDPDDVASWVSDQEEEN